MADRGPIRRITNPNRRLRVFPGGDRRNGPSQQLTDPPIIVLPPDTGSPAGHSTPNLSRTMTRGADRTYTWSAAGACLPLHFGSTDDDEGGPTGGYVIYAEKFGNFWYIDYSLGEGELEEISDVTFDDRPAAASGITVELHTGAAGDTGSTIIDVVNPGYVQPDQQARVVCKIPATGEFAGTVDPFGMKCKVKGLIVYDSHISDYIFKRGMGYWAQEVLVNTRWGGSTDYTRMNVGEFLSFQDWCDEDIGGGVLRWQGYLKIDQQSSLQDVLSAILAHCEGHLKYVGGRFGVWWDAPRDNANERADDDTDTGIPIQFWDHSKFIDTYPESDKTNLEAEPTVVWRGRTETPTVVVVDYSDEAGEWVDASVQIPEAGPTAGLPWIEKRLRLPGITTSLRAIRRATDEYNFEQYRNRDIGLAAWMYGLCVEPGDRIRVNSRILIPLTTTPPNTGAVEGFEDLQVVDQKVEGQKVLLRCHPYRDDAFGAEPVDPGPPTPPAPPDPDVAPDPVTDLEALHADPTEYGKYKFTPSVSPYVSYYNVYDTWSGLGAPIFVRRIYSTEPLDGAGKHNAYNPELVHDNGAGDYELSVTVYAIATPSMLSSTGEEDSWTEPIPDPGGGDATVVPACAASGIQTSIGDTATYIRTAHTKVPLTFGTSYARHNSIVGHASGDFFVSVGDNNTGILFVRESYLYDVAFGYRFDENNDSDYRCGGVISVPPRAGSDSGSPTYGYGHILGLRIQVTSDGTGYDVGDVLNFTGGTMLANGIPIEAEVATVSGGGDITSLLISYGLGYSVAPTVASVTSAGGSGATFSVSLAPSRSIASLFGAPGAPTYGALILEDQRSGIASSSAHPSGGYSRDIYLTQGTALILVAQQSSGGSENVILGYDDSITDCDLGQLTFLSLHGISTELEPPAEFSCVWELPE